MLISIGGIILDISVCIITKNEADKLEKCLLSLKKYNLQIVVVDTGSTDNTSVIIDKYADISGSYKWCDDFQRREIIQSALQVMTGFSYLTAMNGLKR